MPSIAVTIDEGRTAIKQAQDVLTGLKNNPLLKGGIPERRRPAAPQPEPEGGQLLMTPPRWAPPLRPLALAAALALASCSTAPKPPEGVFDQRNKAAELAKLGDGFMAKAQYSKALEYYEDALKASSAVDDLEGVAASHASMGKAYLAAGRRRTP